MTTYYNYLGVAMPVSAQPNIELYGTGGNNQTLISAPGPSSIASQAGVDNVLVGGQGDDTFYVDDPTDIVSVAGGLSGIKTIVAFQQQVLPANVQNLTFYSSLWGVGNSLNNLIIMGGNDANVMNGGAGNDVLVGGFGQNNIQETAGIGSDVIYNFHTYQDTVQLTGAAFTTFAQIQSAMTQVGPDVVLQIDPTDTMTFRNVQVSNFAPKNFLMPLNTALLGPLTFDAEFNTLQLYNYSTGTGQWLTNFGGPSNALGTYNITSNDEKEVYTSASFQGSANYPLGYNPFSISNGLLTITAQQFSPVDSNLTFDQPFSSGMLNTKGIFEQQYGYFEMRAELPTALGTWPAFWLSQDPYQPGVEADILEHLAIYPNVAFSRINDAGTVTPGVDYQLDPTGFHTYGLLWTPTVTTIYVDDVAVLSVPTPASWDKPMYMLMNMAVGGWGGPIDTAAYPAQMVVDYVRVYGLADNSQIVENLTPPAPSGTLMASGAAVTLANTVGWTDAQVLENGVLAVTGATNTGWGSQGAQAGLYDPGTGASLGAEITLNGYAAPGQTMDPVITVLPGGFWQVSYAGANAPQGTEIYNGAGQSVFFQNQYAQSGAMFTPTANGGHVVTGDNPTAFAVVGADGGITWFNDPTINGQPAIASAVHPLSNGGFFFTYAGQTQIDVFDATGATDMTGSLGAPVSTFAMASDAMTNGQFAVAWLSPPAAGGFNMELTFQTFAANGAPLTAAAPVALDADPWHTTLEVIATGQPGDALMLWSQGGAINGAYAHGSVIDPATPLIVGDLATTTQTALSDSHVLLTWLQSDNGVQDLWAEILDPTTMTGAQQELGPADGTVHVVALPNGGYAASWHLGAQIDARAYDGAGNYGAVTTVAGDFVGADTTGDIAAIYQDPVTGAAILQHYAVTSFLGV